jgi:hypothetical protein
VRVSQNKNAQRFFRFVLLCHLRFRCSTRRGLQENRRRR